MHNISGRAIFVVIALIVCNVVPNCAGRKTEISRSFAMPVNIGLPSIVSFSPRSVSGAERVFVSVQGVGFDKQSRLLINGFFVVGKKYMRVINENHAIVKIPKGVPRGRYSVVVKNPDGNVSNEVQFEIVPFLELNSNIN
ncbi:MAG: IPT/TIG domain-containing protein [Candidatus Omnitrophica bacterium]|nr:IPT/TIG domain-containing protein [Candidatus Omnitrophota bacterium]